MVANPEIQAKVQEEIDRVVGKCCLFQGRVRGVSGGGGSVDFCLGFIFMRFLNK